MLNISFTNKCLYVIFVGDGDEIQSRRIVRYHVRTKGNARETRGS
jgi:hypothetical protein